MTKKILFLISLITIFVSFSYSQTSKSESSVIESGGNACEENSAFFDAILTEATNNKERVFAIFRAGDGETETVNAKRLAHVKWFLENRKGWKSFIVVYARGEKSAGEGKIEFYIGGKPFLIVASAKNRTPCLDCCNGGLEYQQNLVKKRTSRKRKS